MSENDLSCFDRVACKQDVIIFLSLATMYFLLLLLAHAIPVVLIFHSFMRRYFAIFSVALVQAIRFRSYMRRIFHLAAASLGSIRCAYCTLVAVNFLPSYQGLWDYRRRIWQVVLMQMPILLLLFMFSLVFFFWFERMKDYNTKLFNTNNQPAPATISSKMKYIIVTVNVSIACMLVVVWLFMTQFSSARDFLLDTVHAIQGFFALVWAICFGWISLRAKGVSDKLIKLHKMTDAENPLKIFIAICTMCSTCFASRAILLLLEIWIVGLSDNVFASVAYVSRNIKFIQSVP
jgi:hypothetical protein